MPPPQLQKYADRKLDDFFGVDSIGDAAKSSSPEVSAAAKPSDDARK